MPLRSVAAGPGVTGVGESSRTQATLRTSAQASWATQSYVDLK